jgi:hypothetical protein
MKSIVVLACLVAGGFSGYQIGLWWLDRTVESAELETAVYPGIGTIAGSLFGLALGLFVVWLSRGARRPSEISGKDAADEGGPSEPDPQRRG